MAVVAAAMSVHGEIRGWQKAIWMGLIGALLVVELLAINKDRADSQVQNIVERNTQDIQFQAVRRTQDEDFKATAKGLENSYAQSQQQFDASMARADAIYKKTRTAATTAQEAVADLTGGDSFILISPSPAFLTSSANAGQLNLMVSVVGKHALWDVRVEMAETSDALKFYQDGHVPQTIALGAVSNTYASPLGPLIRPSQDKESDYYFWTYSRNLPTVETLRLRFNNQRNEWECAWTIFRTLEKPQFKKQVLQDFPWAPMAPPPMVR